MPQIQILPGIQGLGESLGQGLGSGLQQGIGTALSQMLEQKSQQAKTNQLLSALGLGPQQEASSLSETSAPHLRAPSLKNLTQEQVLAASIMNPALAPALGSIYKTQQKEFQEARSEETGQKSLDRMADLLQQGNLGLFSKKKGKVLGGETAEHVGEFESLSGALEALLVDKVSRGTLSNARFKYITETLLPKPDDREATIRGKLKALSKELNLKLPESLNEKQGLKKVSPGTKLSEQKASEILSKSGGDPEKARKLAKQLGYEF